MQHSKVIVVAFTEPRTQDFTFSKWPNHITIVPYFRVQNIDKLKKDVTALAGIGPIPYEVGQIEYFGAKKDVRVSRVVAPKIFHDLHNSLAKIALEHDKNLDTLYGFENYKPHITHNEEPYPEEKDKGVIDAVYIVKDLELPSREKRVIEVIQII